jgi:hypothetical protein
MKRLIAWLTIVALAITGCTGSFRATKNVNNFHRHRSQKLIDELVFLGCIPIYGVAVLGDVIIFNTIEFWSGRNPITASQRDSGNFAKGGETQNVFMEACSYNEVDGTITIQHPSFPENKLIIKRNTSGIVAQDASGNVLYTSSEDPSGGLSLYDGEMNLIRYFTPEEVLAKTDNIFVPLSVFSCLRVVPPL